MAALREREPGAEAEFVARYRGLAVGIAIKRFGLSRDDGEAVFQELVARLWADDHRALRAWRGQGKLSTYLTVIVSRLCLARRQSPRDSLPLETVADIPSSGRSADQRSEAGERTAAVRDALASLRPRDRLLLTARYLDERAPAEIAPMLGLSPGTCRKGIHDALKRLRRRMRRAHPELFE